MPVTKEHIETAKVRARDYGATRLVIFGSGVDDPENARDLEWERMRIGLAEARPVFDRFREQVDHFLDELDGDGE